MTRLHAAIVRGSSFNNAAIAKRIAPTPILTMLATALGFAFFQHPAIAQSESDGNSAADNPKVVVVKAKIIHSPGSPNVTDGIILIRDGRIESIGRDIQIPDGANIIDIPGAVVTPGLIDAHAAIDMEVGDLPTRTPRRRNTWQTLATQQLARQEKPAQRFAAQEDEQLFAEQSCPHSESHEFCEGLCPHCGAPLGAADTAGTAVGASPVQSTAEQASEVTPQLRALDSINLLSNDFERLLKGGVTTVWVSPDSASVIGMRGAIVKTGGPLKSRIVRDADAVKASMGSDPVRRGAGNIRPIPGMVSFMTRRPTTRMGVAWVFRKAFYDAIRIARGSQIHGADSPPPDAVPTLLQVLKGEIPLRIQARQQHDILTALRLAEEFGLGIKDHENADVSAWRKSAGAKSKLPAADRPVYPLIIEEATEAFRCLPELKAANVPVIYGPIFDEPEGWRNWSGEAGDPRLNTACQLRDAGVKFAITANDMRDEAGLVRQAMNAVSFGLSADDALSAITTVPADLLGLRGKLGSLAAGSAADLVVWSSDPFDAASRAILVMIDGQVVYKE